MNALSDRLHTQNGVIRHRRNGILHPVEVFSGRNRLLLTQMLHVALKLG